MTDDVKQLLVPPHVALQRGNIKVPHQYCWACQAFRPTRHAFDKIELLPEFRVQGAVGDISASRDVDIFQPYAVGQSHTDMTRLPIGLPVESVILDQRDFGKNGNAVVHRLPT